MTAITQSKNAYFRKCLTQQIKLKPAPLFKGEHIVKSGSGQVGDTRKPKGYVNKLKRIRRIAKLARRVNRNN